MQQGALPFEAVDDAPVMSPDWRSPGQNRALHAPHLERRPHPGPELGAHEPARFEHHPLSDPPASRESGPATLQAAPVLARPSPIEAPATAAAVVAPVVSLAPVFVRSPRAKRYILRVKGDGSVRVTVPRWGSKREALQFVERQHGWIAKQRQRIATAQTDPQAPPLSEPLQRELQERARRELPPRLMALAKAFELTVSRISIRNQRWRWGSCNRDGHICLNWRLVAMPEWVRDYVLIHELMHLKRMDHSPRFWKLVAAACPSYREARAWLRTNQHLLDARI